MSKPPKSNPKFNMHNNVHEYLQADGFEINDVMFTNFDLVQALMYVSPFCYSVVTNKFNPTGVNSFMITINAEDEVIMCTAGRQSRIRASAPDDMNTVMVHKETGSVTFFFTTGYMFDIFNFMPPKPENDGKFILEQTGDLIIFRHDLERLMKA